MRRLLALVLIGSTALACPVGKSGPPQSKRGPIKVRSKRTPSSDVALPTAGSVSPWGGSDRSRWKPEAILANYASRALNEGWTAADVEDVLVSIPVKMKPSGLPEDRPYGDGQTNAGVSLGWNESEPQLVMTLIQRRASRQVRFWLSAKIKSDLSSLKVGSAIVPLTKTDDGYVGTWLVPVGYRFGTIEHSQIMWVKPNGWTSSFPMDFRFPVFKNADLLKAAGQASTAGRPVLDPMGLHESAKGKIVQDVLMQTSFGPEWIKNDKGGDYFEVSTIHARVAGVRTAIGAGHTWVIDRGAHSTFKNLYTCFDERNVAAEAADGVPSGGGWHEIGDAAETIMNSVESGSVFVGQATGVPYAAPDEFAYGLSDVATMRLLEPGEGLMTGAGNVTWEEDRPAREGPRWPDGSINWGLAGTRGKSDTTGRGRNYHWFAFNSSDPTCTQEWVHNCRPTSSNSFGLTADCK